MKRDVNASLMVLLLLASVAILALILYNTYAYHNLGSRYTEARKEIEKAYVKLNVTQQELTAKNKELAAREAALAEKEAQVNKYFNDLNLSKSRETSLGEMFNDIRDENTKLSSDVESLNVEIDEKDREVRDITRSYNAKVTQYVEVVSYCDKIDVKLLEVGEELGRVNDSLRDMKRVLDSLEDEGNESVRSEARSANNKRAYAQEKVASIDGLLVTMEYWAARFREARG